MSHHHDVCDECCRATCICGKHLEHQIETQEQNVEAFSESLKGRKALDRWAKLNDESQGC
jgi:hypothetical protein